MASQQNSSTVFDTIDLWRDPRHLKGFIPILLKNVEQPALLLGYFDENLGPIYFGNVFSRAFLTF